MQQGRRGRQRVLLEPGQGRPQRDRRQVQPALAQQVPVQALALEPRRTDQRRLDREVQAGLASARAQVASRPAEELHRHL